MIVPMKKLTMLLFHKEKEQFLDSLQDLGVVHVVVNPQLESSDLNAMQEKMKAAERVSKALKRTATEKKISVSQDKTGSAEEIIKAYDGLVAQHESLEQQITKLKRDATLLEPWGDFDPASVDRLKQAGVVMRFFKLPEKGFNSLNKENLYFEVVSRREGSVYFVLLQQGEPVLKDIEDIAPPRASLKQTIKAIEDYTAKQAEIDSKIGELARYQDVLDQYRAGVNSRFSLESARLSMEGAAEGRVFLLEGWLPAEKEKKVAEFLGGFSAWYELKEPQPGDKVPILLKNSKKTALFEAITKLFDLPDYFELDPTPFFAPFFALFYGLCFGDVGYGMIVIITMIIVMKKAKPALKPFFQLGLILGITTAIAGLLLNSFFGQSIFNVPGTDNALLPFNLATWASPLSSLETPKGTYYPMMTFAMYLGGLQIILGIILQMVNKIRNAGFLSGLGVFAYVPMVLAAFIFLARVNFMDIGIFAFTPALPLGRMMQSVPTAGIWFLLISGLVLLFLFHDMTIKIPPRLGLGFWKLYNFASGLIGNGLSYLRLFALGLAGGLLGASFNQIAFMLITDEQGTVHYSSFLVVFTIIILIAGHGFNMALSALGAFAHTLRLTFVEFYGNLSFSGGGKAYKPLSKKANY